VVNVPDERVESLLRRGFTVIESPREDKPKSTRKRASSDKNDK
jgi:hypothetical protein